MCYIFLTTDKKQNQTYPCPSLQVHIETHKPNIPKRKEPIGWYVGVCLHLDNRRGVPFAPALTVEEQERLREEANSFNSK